MELGEHFLKSLTMKIRLDGMKSFGEKAIERDEGMNAHVIDYR